MGIHADALTQLRGVADAFLERLSGSIRWSRDARNLALRDGVTHRIAWVIPQDAIAGGWEVNAAEDVDVTADLDSRLGVEDLLMQAGAAARLDGGAWLWPVLRGNRDLGQPLPPGPHDVVALQVLERAEVVPVTWESDPESPDFGRPLILSVTPQRDGTAARSYQIHRSRLIYVPGLRATPGQDTGQDGYDLSLLDVYGPAIDSIVTAWTSGASLIERLSMPVLTMASPAGAAADRDTYASRMDLIRTTMRTWGLMALFGGDSLTWTGPSVAGYGDLMRSMIERLCLPEGIPASRMIGQAPAGLTSDDRSGTRTYHDTLRRIRRLDYRPVLLRLYDIALGIDLGREIVWPDLDRPTALEASQISLTRAQRDAVLVQFDAIGSSESRERFRGPEERDVPVLLEEYDDPGSIDETVAPPDDDDGAP